MTKPHVLVVQNERIVALNIRNELETMGYVVPALASSGAEAIEKTAETHPDLVLMDIVLKGDMDGIETARRLRERFDIPVIYLSAYEDEDTLGRALGTEPFGYLLKPYEERELHTTIEVALYKHRMEQRCKHTARWLAGTLRCINDAVIATDARQAIHFMNPIAEALTGWQAEEALGKDWSDVCRLQGEEDSISMEQLAARAIRDSIGVDLPEGTLVTARDRRETPVEGSVAPIYDDEGNYTGVVIVFRDITQRLRLEAVQRQNDEQRRQAQKMEAVSRLASGVAHDFNNLLTAILGNTSLYLESLHETAGNRELLVNVEAAARRAAELVEDLLSFSGRTRVEMEPLSLNSLLQEMLPVLRRILDPRTLVNFQPGQELWPVHADPQQFNEALIHLCMNAQDAMPEGGRILIETENLVLAEDALLDNPQTQPGEHVRLRVRDTGRGIPAEIRPRIFEPFYTTKEPGKGAGLGLALVFGIVEQHHGWIDCLSETDQGTCFEIYLPRYWQKAPMVRLTPAPMETRVGPKTILLADDEAMIRDLGRTILQRHGYHVLLAEDGLQALEIYQRERQNIDLVILDLTMPRMSGDSAFRQMADIDPNVRVLFSSGYFAEDMAAGDERILGFLSKPYRHEELVNMVGAALERAEGISPAAGQE